jgi:transcriptional regulator with XRE-family HTH domain
MGLPAWRADSAHAVRCCPCIGVWPDGAPGRSADLDRYHSMWADGARGVRRSGCSCHRRCLARRSAVDAGRGLALGGHSKIAIASVQLTGRVRKGTSWQDLPHRRLSETGSPASAPARFAYDLGRQVRELRESLGISQRELADRMGTTQSVIARLEGGGSRPSLTTLERLAEAVGRQVEVRFRKRAEKSRAERADRRKSSRSRPPVDLAQLAANLRLSPAERLARGTAFSRWVLRNRGRARAGVDGRARLG